eukprot:c29376_g2_i2 orf=80-940(+)
MEGAPGAGASAAPSDANLSRSFAQGNQLPAKVRKVSGRKENLAVHYAISPAEDDYVIRHRLLTRTTTTRGEPPLKKLLKKFITFATEVEKDSDNILECEKLFKSFLQELSTFEFPLLKTKAVINANRREQENFQELQAGLNRQILQVQVDIEELKVQLEESKIERQHKEECEAIRRLIAAQPPRSKTQKVLDDLERELAVLEAENMAALKTLELRKKQFALLMHVVDDLQNTIEEEQKNSMEDPKIFLDEQKSIVEDKTNSDQDMVLGLPMADITVAAEPMQIDAT